MSNPVEIAQAPARGRRRTRRRLLATLALLAAAVVAMHEHVVRSVADRIVGATEVAPAELLVVPGARIHADGTPYAMLAERLQTALDLYRRGKAPRVLLSGQGAGGLAEDEVGAMRRWLEAHGVPGAALVEDPLGLRTLDTLHRSREVFRAHRVIVVTNPFHVARAVFLGTQCGLDVSGVAAPYQHEYGALTMLKQQSREAVARVWAWCDAFVFGACR